MGLLQPLQPLMETLLRWFLTLNFTILSLLFCFFLCHSKRANSCRRVPQAGGAWPVIGHMHLFGSKQLLHKTLAAMADKYGPVFTLKIGSNRVLTVNNWETARECFTSLDRTFSDRPTIRASKLLGYDSAMFGFAPYGPYWREMRKIATVELLSAHRIDMLKHIRASEVQIATRQVYKSWLDGGSKESGVMIDMKQWLGDLTSNVALRMVGGKRFFGPNSDMEEAEARRCKKVMRDFGFLFGVFVLSDCIPFLGWLDLNGYEKRMKRTAKELDILIGGWLEEHKQIRLVNGKDKKEKDFMDMMLNILEDARISGFDADTINKATCLNLMLAGSDTTMVTLTWALSLLLNNQQQLKKAKDELDIHVGKDRNVDETDIKNLVYLQAIVKETLRLYPAEPVIGLRSSMEDCILAAGYHVPTGTQLMVNVWKIQRDERVWSDPDKFKPERFLSSHREIDLRGQSFEFIPFGSGRRSCPGITLALRVVEFTLATLLHSFDVIKTSSEDVDMTESPGLTNLKATPLDVLLVPRLHSRLYGL